MRDVASAFELPGASELPPRSLTMSNALTWDTVARTCGDLRRTLRLIVPLGRTNDDRPMRKDWQ
jgi:hypothetical protein